MRSCRVSSLAGLLALLSLPGCGNNTLNPFCGSARPVPLIGSISPSAVAFTQVQHGTMLVVNGSHFVSSSEIVINGTPLGATVVNENQLKIKLTTSVISGPGSIPVMVRTPSGNSGDLGCDSGGNSSVLTLTVN